MVRIGLVWFSGECRQPLETETALADESAVLVELVDDLELVSIGSVRIGYNWFGLVFSRVPAAARDLDSSSAS